VERLARIRGAGPVNDQEVQLARLMVFIGRNDTGKTSLLRGLASALDPAPRANRQGWWAPRPELARQLRDADPAIPESERVWMEWPLETGPAHYCYTSYDAATGQSEEQLEVPAAVTSPLTGPVDEVAWLTEPTFATLSARLQGYTLTELGDRAVDTYGLLPAFCKSHYARVFIRPLPPASRATTTTAEGPSEFAIGLVTNGQQAAEYSAEELAAGVRSVLLIALGEALRRAESTKTDARVLFLADEPELHLHPLGQRAIADWLMALLAGAPKCSRMAVATHSPAFLDVALHQDGAAAWLCERRPADFTSVAPLAGHAVADLVNTAERAGLRPSDLYLAAAGTVLVVEGKHEVLLLPHFWRLLYGKLPEDDGVRLLPGGGVDNIPTLLGHVTRVWPPGRRFVLLDGPADTSKIADQGLQVVQHGRSDILGCITLAAYRKAGLCRGENDWEWELLELKGKAKRKLNHLKTGIDRLVAFAANDLQPKDVDDSLRKALDGVRATAAQAGDRA